MKEVCLFVFSASQRGNAYLTPWNWCLINLPFLMWDVVTWSYFFPSLSAEKQGHKTQERRFTINSETFGAMFTKNVQPMSETANYEVCASKMAEKHLLTSVCIMYVSCSLCRTTKIWEEGMKIHSNTPRTDVLLLQDRKFSQMFSTWEKPASNETLISLYFSQFLSIYILLPPLAHSWISLQVLHGSIHP